MTPGQRVRVVVLAVVASSCAHEPRCPCPCPAQAVASVEAPPPRVVSVALTRSGAVFVDGQAVATASEAAAKVHALTPAARVVIAADAEARHGDVIHLVEALKAVGVVHVSFAVDAPRGPSSPE
ncbi:MAG: biopolymer transporter ExbD [Myxococcota bacterium]